MICGCGKVNSLHFPCRIWKVAVTEKPRTMSNANLLLYQEVSMNTKYFNEICYHYF